MQTKFVTEYDKKLKYRVYEVNNGKRKLIKKGAFMDQAQTDIMPNGNEIIVRVSKTNTWFFAFFIWLYNVFVGLEDLSIIKVNWFYEIKVTITDLTQPLVLGYVNWEGASGETVSVFDGQFPRHVDMHAPLYCVNQPFAVVPDKNNAVNSAFIAVSIVCIIALICALVLLIGRGIVVL